MAGQLPHIQGGAQDVEPFYIYFVAILLARYLLTPVVKPMVPGDFGRGQFRLVKMADRGRLIIQQRAKTVLLYAEIKSVVLTQRRFRQHFNTRWAPVKSVPSASWISIGTQSLHCAVLTVKQDKPFAILLGINKSIPKCLTAFTTFAVRSNCSPVKKDFNVVIETLLLVHQESLASQQLYHISEQALFYEFLQYVVPANPFLGNL
ncbi:hypothetical protein C0J52_02188 [Blattella germanica]|nr:hypothetical protein C0J52_02188 [Blattella germanica]